MPSFQAQSSALNDAEAPHTTHKTQNVNMDHANPASPELQSRVNELEIQLSYMDDTLEQLNGIVTQQTLELTLLKQQLQLMAQKLAGFEGDGEGVAPFVPAQNIPPHY